MRATTLCVVGGLVVAAAMGGLAETLPADPGVFDACMPCGKARAARALVAARDADADGTEGRGPREAFDATDVQHYALDIEIDPGQETISGSNAITVRSLVDGLTEFTIRLRSNYTISSADVDGVPVNVSTVSPTTRVVTLDRAYDAGEVFTLTIYYSGQAVSAGFGSINFTTAPDGTPLVFTLSEPYYAYTWWPVKDGDWGQPGDNADKATVELAVTAPANLRTVSNGVLAGVDDLPGNRRRYRWRTDYPTATYLVAFSSAEYHSWTVTYDYGTGTMPVEFNIFPADDTPENRADWEAVVGMLDVFRPLYGLYPFINEKYGIYEFGFGGGMEHQTNTGQGVFLTWVSAHELGHQWWGDNVTCRTWHDIWLNEGFATYSEALWREFRSGSDNRTALKNWMAIRRPDVVEDTVYVYDTTDVGRMFNYDYTYKKAAWVLHQLRHVVGDATFFQILADYRAVFEGSAATTDDFAAVAAATSGRDLSWFFDEWVYNGGAPAYAYGWQTVQIRGQNYVRLSVQQTQAAAGMPVFAMPLDVWVDHGSGSSLTRIWNDAELEHYVLPIPAAASDVVLDPNAWVLHTANDVVGYVPGPPAIVQTVPAPGAQEPAAPAAIEIVFSEDVNASSGDFQLVGDATGPAAFDFSYDAANFTVVLTPVVPLEVDDYSVMIADSVTSVAAGAALDGEVDDPFSAASLPSGDGQPGGAGVFGFRVAGGCPADLDGSGLVDLADLAVLLANFGTNGAGPRDGDVDGDHDVDLSDLSALLAVFGTGC